MRRSLIVIAFILFPMLISAQVQDTIYVWDNDRGTIRHFYPAVGADDAGGYIAWQDGRTLDYDIWRTNRNWYAALLRQDREVSVDVGGNYWQTWVDCEGNPTSRIVYVWEDSLYTAPPGPTRVMAAIDDGNPFQVFGGTSSYKNPSVACADDGQFIVSSSIWGSITSNIRLSRHNTAGGIITQYSVYNRDSLRGWVPKSRVAYCDSGYVVVYEDSTTTNSRSIFLHYCDRNGNVYVPRLKVTNPGNPAETFNETAPGVSVNSSGFVVVVWEDTRNSSTSPDIYCRTFQMRPGSGTITPGAELLVYQGTYNDQHARCAVFPNNDYVVVWQQYMGNAAFAYDIRARMNWQSSFRTIYTMNVVDTLSQNQPDVEAANNDGFYVAWQSNPGNNVYDIYGRSFIRVNNEWGMAPMFTPETLLTPDTVGGRKAWYFDDENYDNPLTPGWDEDPIPEPDSIFAPLEFAIVDQIMELNTNNQYLVMERDTLPYRQGLRALGIDAMFLDLGFRTDLASAGLITPGEQTVIQNYLNPAAGDGQPVMVEGNDFGYLYSGTTLYPLFHATYMGDGGPYESGNIDTLYGTANTFSRGETLLYDYKSWSDNYPDSLSPYNGGRVLLWGSGATDWTASRSIGFENAWKDKARRQGNTVYNSFMLSAVKSGDHPHTYAEYYRRMMGFLHLACQPEPITTLTSTPDAGEGTVKLTWNIVSDDSLAEPANGGYELKFARAKMTSEAAYSDSSEEYYQKWSFSGSPGTPVSQGLYGLPPLDTIVFALKVKDDEGLWDALGAEPRAVVSGDSLTPHTITVGDNFVKDFGNLWELFDIRSGDSLFMTWDRNNFFVGFSRCKFKTAGDLFIYVDTKSGGADSTTDYSGAAGRSYFGAAFHPDYVFIFDDSSNYKMQKYSPTKGGRNMWHDTTFSGRIGADSIVNNYNYTEISIPFQNMRYDTMAGFKVMVLVQSEASNNIWNSFPPNNPAGGTGLFLPYYYFAANGMRSNLVPNHGLVYIGLAEESGNSVTSSYLLISPNPFRGRTVISYGIADIGSKPKGLRIYDITGRLVKTFSPPEVGVHSAVTWAGEDDIGRKLPSGVYFVSLEAADRTEMVKTVYLR